MTVATQREQVLRLAQAHGIELTEAQVELAVAALPTSELTDADLENLASGKVMDPGWGYPGWGYGPGWGGYGPGWGGYGPRWGGGAMFIRW